VNAKEELVAGLKWMLDTSEDNADYLAQLIIAAVEEKLKENVKASAFDHWNVL
jgi:hypothetical protein